MRARPPALTTLAVLALAGGGAAGARADEAAAALTTGALQRCAAIAGSAERLACYDQLAGRPSQAPAAAAPPPAEFGLSPAQRPQPEQVHSISARVVAFGRSAAARPTVALDNGQLWELDQEDPLLAVGDAVTIRRGALTSFLLDSPQHRTHRVRRLR